MRYHKGNEASAMRAAKHSAVATGQALYLVPTCEGIQIVKNKPANFQPHYAVAPDGSVKYWAGFRGERCYVKLTASGEVA